MKNLNKIVTKNYAYIKNGVIFNVMPTKYPDSCAMEINSENAPYITVDGVKYFFDAYIEDGDTYTPSTGFMKSIHKKNSSEEKSISFQQYYYELCEEQITNTIVYNYTKDYNYYKDNLLEFGIPIFMFSGHGTVTNIDQIVFNEAKYNQLKQERIKELSLEAAENVAKKYDYSVTDSAKQCFDIVKNN